MGGAEITAIRNKVDKVNARETREAVVKDGVVEGDQVQTKAGSLAELTFSDKSIARLGANAIFTYSSQERLVKIDKGTVLMQTPPGNGGATITSGGVTGAITGTTFLLTASPAKCSDCSKELTLNKGGAAACIAHPDIKQAGTGGFALCVLEGKNSTKVTGPNGVTVEIMPGQMTVVGPSSSGAPKVFVVNLAQILRTSPLIQAFPEPLPSFSAIQQAAIQQQQSGVIKSTGATCLAISSDGDILVGESKPPDPGKRVFEMAVNKPIPGGNKDDSAKDAGLEDIETAAGGDGGAGGGVPSGGGTRGTGALGSSVPSTPNPPVTPPPPPNSNPATTPTPTTLPAIVLNASVSSKVYDGLFTATVGNALLSGIQAGDTVSLAGAMLGTFERNLPGTLIPVSTVMSLVGAGSGNYTLTQPTGLKGEITGSATLNRDGASVNVNSAEYVHIRNTTATRVQGGLSIQSTGGSVLLENSSFSAWMQKSSGGITLDALGMGVIQFSETAGVVVDKPILGIKMSSVPGGDMFLGDYRLTVSHYPTGTPGSPNDKTVDVLNHTAAALDPIGYGSAANGANLILRDGAVSSINSIDYASFDTASGDYKPNSPVSGLISSLATGLWNFLFSNESLNPNGQVDEVKLKYQEGKAVIRGAQGVEIVNVRFEGMDEVELEAASLGGRVLMSGTLVSDPTIGKIAMKALSSVQKDVLTGAGLPNSMDAVEAEINNPNFTGKSDITIAGDRALQIAAINVAGQLALNSHTIVFNNANVTSAGVIDARTRDGMVNRTYGSVVPGTVNFMGVNGNNFLNTANNASMSIANSANIVNALNGGQMRENGVGGATVMNVGRR